VLDEPTSALDPTAAEEVLATLTRLVHDLGISVLLAEHRLERVVPFADRMVLLVGDGTVRSGPPAEVLAGSPVVPPIVELGRSLGWSPLPMTVRDARRLARDLDLGTPPPLPAPSYGEPVLSGEHLTVIRGGAVALRDTSVALRPGTVTALMGRNGSGKSTLLWTIQGSRERLAGAVSVRGTDPSREPAGRRRDLVGLVPQTAADLLYLETVAEECTAADGGTGECRKLLDRLVPGVPDDVHPRDLSEGQRLALALAVVLVSSPPALLLDEPTRGLDYPAKAELADALRQLADAGHAVMVATHDVEFAAASADEAVVLAEGEVVSSGSTRAVLAASPAFAPQVTKILGPGWLRLEELQVARR
jgi:energy-coupling factor transport system ATP-binding protein